MNEGILSKVRPAACLGFSLLELVLILAVIATVAAMAAPRYHNALTRYRADGVAGRIAADLGLAQATAKSTSASVTVTFDVPNNSYQLSGVPSLIDPESDAGLTLSDRPYRAQLVSVDFSGADVVFDGYGIPDDGGGIVIACGGVTRTVDLNGETGAASVQ